MAKELSMTEKYALLMLYGGGNRTDFMACQSTAGIVLGGLFELLQSKHIFVGRGNKLMTDRKTGSVNEWQATLYDNICARRFSWQPGIQTPTKRRVFQAAS